MPNRPIREDRRKVGPADPETRRRLLNERLAEREPNRYGKGETKPAVDNPTRDLSAFNVGRKLRAARVRREEEAGNP